MERTKIFISWSGERSRLLAEIMHKWIPRIIQSVDPWMSERDLEKGDRWFHSLSNELSSKSIGLICVTPENQKSPWLLFEAGAISRDIGKSKVCPVIYGMSADELSSPLNLFQATLLCKGDFFKLLRTINEINLTISSFILEDALDRHWDDIDREIKDIPDEIDGTPYNIKQIAEVFSKSSFFPPEYGRHVHFSSGFESHHLYQLCYKTAKKRLYIWGRKNRKAFDKDHHSFFEGLNEKLKKGFDFKVLFLGKDSPEEVLYTSHKDSDIKNQISICIKNAVAVLEKFGIDKDSVAREYRSIRSFCIILVDDALIYTPVLRDENGIALKLTQSPFNLVDSNSKTGRQLLEEFEKQWEHSYSLTHNMGDKVSK